MVTIGYEVRHRSEFDRKLGARLLKARKQARLTREKAAQTAGVHYVTLGKWEIGKQRPSLPKLVALAKLYGISTGALLDGLA